MFHLEEQESSETYNRKICMTTPHVKVNVYYGYYVLYLNYPSKEIIVSFKSQNCQAQVQVRSNKSKSQIKSQKSRGKGLGLAGANTIIPSRWSLLNRKFMVTMSFAFFGQCKCGYQAIFLVTVTVTMTDSGEQNIG